MVQKLLTLAFPAKFSNTASKLTNWFTTCFKINFRKFELC